MCTYFLLRVTQCMTEGVNRQSPHHVGLCALMYTGPSCVCVCVCIHVCVYVCLHICMYVYVCVYIYYKRVLCEII
jgi:hypothetical protein